VLRFCPKKGKFRRSTDAFHRLRLPAAVPSTPCQPAIEFEDELPLQSEKSTPLLVLQVPAPTQALSPRRAPSPLVLAPVPSPWKRSPAPARPPAPSAAQPADTAPASGSGYTLVMIWCPFCKKILSTTVILNAICAKKKDITVPSNMNEWGDRMLECMSYECLVWMSFYIKRK
jgi:hypothetical protein